MPQKTNDRSGYTLSQQQGNIYHYMVSMTPFWIVVDAYIQKLTSITITSKGQMYQEKLVGRKVHGDSFEC